VQRPLDALTTRMQRRVEREVSDCDCALLLLNGDQGVGPGDRFIAKLLAGAGVPVVVVVNKVDRINRARTMEALTDAAALDVGDDVFAISARTGEGLPELVAHLEGLMPEGPFLFAADEISDQPRETLIAELIREQALRRTFQEVPHAVEVIVEELDESRADLIEIRATAWVEAESQKGILIGARGAKIKSIGTAARKELERELGRRVHLDLSVRVRRSWRGDDQLLDRLGIE
jgi:GTP-binding protein Era